jgi:type III secretion protein T
VNGPLTAETLWQLIAPLLLATPRILAAVTIAPLFPASLFPTLLRNSVVVALALGVYPHMAASLPQALDLVGWLVIAAKEVLIGLLIGLAVGTLVWVFESVGAMIDFQVGFSNSAFFDPFGGHEAGPITGLMARLAIVLFIAAGGLNVLTTLLYESFRLWPVASFYPQVDISLAELGTESVGSLAQLIVRVAAPAVLLLVLVDLAFGLVSRMVPQLNVFFFTMPIKGALAALMIALYLSWLVDVVADHVEGLSRWLQRLTPVLA